MLRQIYEIFSSEEKLQQVTQSIQQQLSEYIDKTASVSNQARYNQGKLTFDVVTLFVGVGEAKSYLKGNNVFNKLKDYIDKLSSFKGREWSKIIIEEKDIKKKILEVGIPKGATKEQIKQINQAIKYAEQQGIKMNVRVVK
ncbi:hypothetical protein MSHRCOH1_05410 [Candidatus Ornithobacterium hominis]|uniref:endonuclease toxin domain-containing protein n=1 Tax=Candidatus Ornithobacterium hominis TaxID=2497989 RepID=UPI0024BBEF08|nr:hypothetical protein [Candidatus Ornithobacterium hominis]CAI9429630.1 hypothetical protein MSHRCOH1_05410 [Candidatus Ornithobacterium hominis]